MTKKLIILVILTIGALNEMAAIQKLISGFPHIPTFQQPNHQNIP